MPAGYLFVDGSGISDIGHGVLRDRKVLAEEGVVVVIVTVDVDAGEVLGRPELITKGWVHADASAELIDGCADAVHRQLTATLQKGKLSDVESLGKIVRSAAGSFVSQQTRRRPMIVPVVIEV
jgi:ribonuclease J